MTDWKPSPLTFLTAVAVTNIDVTLCSLYTVTVDYLLSWVLSTTLDYYAYFKENSTETIV